MASTFGIWSRATYALWLDRTDPPYLGTSAIPWAAPEVPPDRRQQSRGERSGGRRPLHV
jgi:hypothetical protein